MTSSASNNSPRSSNTGEQGSLADKARRAENRSLPKIAFRKDMLFENVCCMPSSSLSTSKPSRLLQRSLRKAPAGSSMDDTPDDKSSRTSEIQKTCGKGFCFKDDSVNGKEEEEARESSGNLVLEKNSPPTSTEPRGEVVAHLLTPSGGRRLTRDVVNQSNAEAAAAAAASTVDFQVDSKVSRIKRRPEGVVVGADLNVAARSDGIGRKNDDLRQTDMRKEHFKPGHSNSPPSSVIGPDAVDGNLRGPDAASNELPTTDASSSSSDAEHHSHPQQQQQQQQQQVRSSGDILWQFNGRRLSNVCRNLMIESVGQLDGETDPTAGTVAVANETLTGDEHSSGDGYSTEKSNRREFSTADAVLAGGCPFSFDTKAADPTPPAPLDRSERTGVSDTTPIKRETANEFAASSFRNKTAPDAFNSRGEPPLRFLSGSPRRMDRPILSETKTKKKKSGAIDTLLDVDDNSVEFDSMGDKQNSATAAIAAGLCEERSSPGKLRNDSSGGAVTWSGRRGRALERVTYDSGLLLLLKDFIRPDQKKFSVAPSSGFSIDTELAIWEPSDYAPDRHKSVPPAAEASLKPARNDEAAATSMLRSRQASVSPQRHRIAGRRRSRSKGSKGVEFLDAWHRSSPVGAKLGRRTLSKEWQILTLTTTEEITTLIRPSTTTCKDDPQTTEPSISAHDRISSNDASALSEASSSDISGDRPTDVLFHTNSDGTSDTAESSPPSCSDDHIGSLIGDARTDISEDASEDAAKKQSARNAAAYTLAVSSSTRSNNIPSRMILPTDEVSNKENSLKCGRCRDEDSTPPIEVDELAKTSLDSASENQDGTLTQKLAYARDESSSDDLSKLSAEEFLDFSNNNVLPTSWRRSPIQRSDDGDSLVSPNESEFLTEKIYSKTLSPDLTKYKHKSGFATGNAFDDDDDDNLDALVYDDLTLHIAEESDNPAPSSFRATESSVEHIPTERVDDSVGRQPEDSVAAAVGASSGGGSCRPRTVASKQDAAGDATPANRRRSDSSEALPEKAFLESVFSSLGTIIFLLLAALIFHLFNSFVDHEL